MIISEEIMTKAREAVELLSNGLPAMVISGAGISVESKIPPFRGPGGLWEKYDPYEYGHIDTFRKNPEQTWKMLMEIIEGSLKSKPNEAHFALARMEKKGWVGPTVTQNVDGLHVFAGSKDLLEVHGNARRIYCPHCERSETLDPENFGNFSIKCICGQIKRPDIVLFGEQLPQDLIEKAFLKAYEGVNMIIIGTSGIVQPVASIPFIGRSNDSLIIDINPDMSDLSPISDIHIDAQATIGTRALEIAFTDYFS